MPRVTFTADFDYALPGGRSVIAYTAGSTVLIPTAHYEAAKQAGVIDGDGQSGSTPKKAGKNSGRASGGDAGSAGDERTATDGDAEAPGPG